MSVVNLLVVRYGGFVVWVMLGSVVRVMVMFVIVFCIILNFCYGCCGLCGDVFVMVGEVEFFCGGCFDVD